jgi:hypothetical protein
MFRLHSNQPATAAVKQAPRSPRKGWAGAAAKMAASGDDGLLIPDVLEDENFEEWEDCTVKKEKSE